MQERPQAPFTCYQTHLSYWLYKAAGSIAQGVKNAGTRLVVDMHTVQCNQREYSGPAVVSVVSRSLDPYLRLHYISQQPSAFERLKNHKKISLLYIKTSHCCRLKIKIILRAKYLLLA